MDTESQTNMKPGCEGSGEPCLSPEEWDIRKMERRLIAAALEGDANAFAKLCAASTPAILSSLLRITNNREDAEDALQDALLQAFSNLPRFQGKSRFSTWLTRVAINSALMLLRKKRCRREVFTLDDNSNEISPRPWEPVDCDPNPEDSLVLSERKRVVHEAVRALRPSIRHAVQLMQLEEHSVSEAAEKMGISIAAAKGRMFHARAALRKSVRLKRIGRAADPGSVRPFPMIAATGRECGAAELN
ncbi:MAG TPA: sigma-70 family RNA polymerase sigma factor [Terriglobales bacterium]|nr:sigma-70 family RNA polymerase sigma factor [Terriglobales bacterium]